MTAPGARGLAVTTEPPRVAGAEGRVGERPHLRLIRWPVIAVAAVVILFLRRPETLTVAEFWIDDGPIYTDALNRGTATILTDWGGSLILLQRLLVLTETWLPPQWAPVWGNLAALSITALVAAFLAVRLPLDPARRLAIAAGFVLLPGSYDVLGSLSHIQWPLGVFLIAYAFATRPSTWELVPLAFAGLTGPLALFALPLYLGRWWRDRAFALPLIVVASCAAVQGVVQLVSPRTTFSPDLGIIPEVIVTRTTHLPFVAGLLLLALVAVAALRLPRRTALALGGLALAIPLAGMLRATQPAEAFVLEEAGSRYFWLATGILAAMTVAAGSGWTRTIALGVFAVLFAQGALIEAHPVAGWRDASACIGGPVPCVVPVEPRYPWGDQWAVRWSP